MSFSSMTFSDEASNILTNLKKRTGITPNLLARIGLCLSLRDPYEPDFQESVPHRGITIERRVLTGNYDDFLLTLLRQRSEYARQGDTELAIAFKAHMERGVHLLAKQMKTNTPLDRLVYLLPTATRKELAK